jgi:signal transduction histidine kinase
MKHQPSDRVNVLLICDQDSTATEIGQLIEGAQFIDAINLQVIRSEAFLEGAIESSVRVVLIDDGLKAMHGLELLLNAKERFPSVSIVMLTRKSDRQRAVESMKLGATDYIFKRDLNQEVFDRAMMHALESSEQHHQIAQRNAVIDAFFDQAEEAMFLMDIHGEVVIFNEVYTAYERSVEAEQGLPMFILDALGKDDYDHLLNDQKTVSLEVRVRTKDERDLIWRVHYKRIAVEGRYKRILGVIADITAERRSDAQRQETERLELTSRMARILAHEVRNPLTNIRLSADYIAESYKGDDELVSYSDIIERNVARIDELIQRLLQSVRPFEIKKTETNLESFIQTFKHKISDRAELLEADVVIENKAKRSVWMMDTDKIELALSNLVSNAFEAMAHLDKPELRLSFEDTEGEHVIKVSDNGKGMEQSETERLFEAFYTNRKGGMGLGMMMVQKIIEAHKGEITVHSEPNQGTEFVLSLPGL